ncbi:MAG: zinc ribbon domain-containing protein [Deltaproteobacteria bacterium]|nr:zinc ribbon domain-containing protein [Deltaproteobacteria bacterium]
MKCPKCGHEQKEERPDCPRCGLVFAKWSGRPAPAPSDEKKVPAIAAPREETFSERADRMAWAMSGVDMTGEPPSGRNLVVAAVVFALLLAVTVFVMIPSVNPLVAGSWESGDHSFAVKPPPEWIVVTPANLGDAAKAFGGRLPEGLRLLFESKNPPVVGFAKYVPDTEIVPTIFVRTIHQEMPAIDEKARREVAKIFKEGYKGIFDTFALDPPKVVQVDGLDALMLASRSSKKVLVAEPKPVYKPTRRGRAVTGRTAEEWRTYQIASLHYAIPGNSRTFLINTNTDETQAEQHRPALQGAVDSFRVLWRPLPLGPISRNAFIGGMSAGMGAALMYLIFGLVRHVQVRGGGVKR